ncbi:MAG: MBL fold metallo-hydrolase [Gammaproteobacteria bacterium]|nr:MBL fold metallo-hydrolase [Gammaproteobacteria bacterium]
MRFMVITFSMLFLFTACSGDKSHLQHEQSVLLNYPEATAEMTLVQVSEHSYYVQGAAGVATDNQGFISNAGAIVTSDGVVIFDTLGTPALASKMIRLLREVTDQPIKRVIMSHYHADHLYGLQLYKEIGAEIYAPKGAFAYLDSPLAEERLEERRFSLDPWVNEKTYLVKPDHILAASSTMELGGVSMSINYLGGAHSDGDLTLLVEPDRVLYSGDIIFEGRVAFLGDADTRHWLETLEKMETSGLAGLIPGHGSAAKNPTKAIAQTRRYLAYIREVMGSAVEEFRDFSEAYAAADWSEFEKLPAFEAANRRNAYQVFLSMETESLPAQ